MNGINTQHNDIFCFNCNAISPVNKIYDNECPECASNHWIFSNELVDNYLHVVIECPSCNNDVKIMHNEPVISCPNCLEQFIWKVNRHEA